MERGFYNRQLTLSRKNRHNSTHGPGLLVCLDFPGRCRYTGNVNHDGNKAERSLDNDK